jgi:ubiquinone/menaquinone biosynthesis C-methylase UbiE
MDLLAEDKLIWSPVVANSRMNRERNSSGINSYEQEFKFKPELYLEKKVIDFGYASWLDLCCGQGKALNQVALYFYNQNLQDKVKLKGVDLLSLFQEQDERIKCVEFETASIVDWKPDQKYDLITCVHGVHYLGDKLKALEAAFSTISPSGLFVANFDINSIIVEGKSSQDYLKNLFKVMGITYNSRRKVIQQHGSLRIKFGLKYLGADDKSGPNYTGQDAVTSYYAY